MEESLEFQRTLSILRRNFNILQEGSLLERKTAMQEVESTINEVKVDLERNEFEIILTEFSKQLLSCFADKSDQIRETSIRILTEIVARVDDVEPQLKYIYSVLISRTNCHDLEGIEGLPEVMHPSPGQKPHYMTELVEQNEEARYLLLELTSTLVDVMEPESMRYFINETVNLVRVFLMDPYAKV